VRKELLWIWLSEVFYKGNPKTKAAVDSLGTIDELYAAKRELLAQIPGFCESDIKKLEDKSIEKAEKIFSDCMKKGIRIITPHNPEYPMRLWQIPNPPVVLYAKGELLDIDNELAIAMVGTRNTSENGRESAGRIAYDLARHGVVVVSGLAKGIDTVAASAVIRARGKTVAVFGCGVDVIYPAENKSLARKVEETGTLLSEYPPGTRPFPKFFPMRNRIISGLSLGTIVAEAPEKSGALITARYALEQNRDVFAVPSGIFEKLAEGTNNLIKAGAIPVTSAGDVLAEYAATHGEKIKFSSSPVREEIKEPVQQSTPPKIMEEPPRKVRNFDNLAENERKVMEALDAGAETVDGIVQKSGLAVPQIQSALTLLEIRGCIKRNPGNRFRIKD